MKTKFFALLTALCCVCTVFAGNTITYEATEKLAEVTSGAGVHKNAFDVSIASHTFADGKGTITFSGELTEIGICAFYECTGLTAINLPSSVTQIIFYAFYGCSSLTTINLPAGVTLIGENAFGGCSSLSNITLPNSVAIGEYAFGWCSSLDTLVIPKGIGDIGSCAFCGCSGLKSISVETGNTKYDSRNNCNALIETATNTLILGCENSTIPDDIAAIGEFAFCDCALTSCDIPNSVNSIGIFAFSGCTELSEVKLPEGLTSIGRYAFFNCTSLDSLALPNSVTTIDAHAFQDCTGLKTITLSNNLTSIADWAFYGCSSLQTLTIPNSVTTIGKQTFGECTGLQSIILSNNLTSISERLFSKCTSLSSIEIPEGVTKIADYAFEDCEALVSVVLPTSLQSIGYQSFLNCKGLNYILSYATSVPHLNASFTGIPSNVELYVLPELLNQYKSSSWWTKYFNTVLPLGATAVDYTVHNVYFDADTITATCIWPIVDNAASYVLTIKHNDLEVCSYTFDENGRCTHYESAVNNSVAKGYEFMVTGLEAASEYSFTFEVVDADDTPLLNSWGTFYTAGYTPPSPTSVQITEISGLYTISGRIVCDNTDELRIYTVTGIDVTRMNGNLHGVYIVKCGDQTTKVIVK